MKYETEKDILNLVRAFENGTIARDEWKHAEHLTVALYYLRHHDFDFALNKMRAGIFNLLKAFEVDLTKEMPYHETLTVFWMRAVSDFAESKNDSSMAEVCSQLIKKFDKDYPLRFYSRERLFSDQARRDFINGDLPSKQTVLDKTYIIPFNK